MKTSNVSEIYLKAAHLAVEAAKLVGMRIYSPNSDKGVICDQMNYVNQLLFDMPREVVVNSSAEAPTSDD